MLGLCSVFTRHTERSGVWKGVSFTVFLLCSATVAPISVKFCMMVRMCPGCVFFPFGGGIPGIPKIQNFGLLKSEYLQNGK